jgi:ribosomal protein S18 acetylase RimI-like enzyme
MTHITRLTESDARDRLASLVELLADTVNAGASVGFLRPLDAELARRYWQDVLTAVGQGTRILLIACVDDEIVGSVQLDLCGKQNGGHRAEVQKLIVRSRQRRQGIATELMDAIEREARAADRSLLVLDTEAGSAAVPFYEALQWQRVGSIPAFALSTDGVPTPNVIYYKIL